MKAKHQVLIISESTEDPSQIEHYSQLIREVCDCSIDLKQQFDFSPDWITHSNYHLIILNSPKQAPHSPRDPSAANFSILSFLELLKRMNPVTSVIVLAEYPTVEEAVAAIRLGAEDYLSKPFSPDAFQLAVKRGLDRKEILGENTNVQSFYHVINSCQLVSAALDEPKIFEIIQSYLKRDLKSSYSAIFRVGPGGEPQHVALPVEGGEDRAGADVVEILEIALQASNPLPAMVSANELYRFVDRGQLTPGFFIFRFQSAGEKETFCVCLSPQRPAALDSFENRLRLLKAQIEVTARNIEQYQGIQSLVYVDDATGLYNTRYLYTILDREIAQSKASGKSFAVLFMDADRFKSVNDTYGHLVGTGLLNELGSHLKNYVRDTDTVFRYGGDEFVAILSGCDLPTAQAVAERIRATVEQTEFLKEKAGKPIHFTVSIGVALFPDHANTKQAIIQAADQAMYSAKRTTRNCVFIAPMPSVSAASS